VEGGNATESFHSADAGEEVNAEKSEFMVHKMTKQNCSNNEKTQPSDVEEASSYGAIPSALDSHPDNVITGDNSKTSVIEKCTGAKKRKQGFVRHVQQDDEPQDEDAKDKLYHNEAVDEAGSLKGQDPESSEGRNDDPRGLPGPGPESSPQLPNAQAGLPLTKILKAVNYSNSYADGKHDVTVQFKVARYEFRLFTCSPHV
jgi:hypothetical protein